MPGPHNHMDKGELLFAPKLDEADKAEDICPDSGSSQEENDNS
jgi:hypothetical protein